MKFFCALGTEKKFVLSCVKDRVTKQNIPHIPGKYTQPTFLHKRVIGGGIRFHKISIFNHFYMYICCLLNKPKRSRAFFAMGVFGVILMLLAGSVNAGFFDEEYTLQKGEYTFLHGVERDCFGAALLAMTKLRICKLI